MRVASILGRLWRCFFRMLLPTSSKWSPVDIARMNSLAVHHSLGLGLGGSRASASKLIEFCPFATGSRGSDLHSCELETRPSGYSCG